MWGGKCNAPQRYFCNQAHHCFFFTQPPRKRSTSRPSKKRWNFGILEFIHISITTTTTTFPLFPPHSVPFLQLPTYKTKSTPIPIIRSKFHHICKPLHIKLEQPPKTPQKLSTTQTSTSSKQKLNRTPPPPEPLPQKSCPKPLHNMST